MLTISHLCLSALPRATKELVPTTAQTALRRVSVAGVSEIKSDDERKDRDGLPTLHAFDGKAGDDLDADEGYQRWARRQHKGDLDEWIYGSKSLIKPYMDQAEIEWVCHLVISKSLIKPYMDQAEIEWVCHLVIDSLMRTKSKYSQVLGLRAFWTQEGLQMVRPSASRALWLP